MTRIAVVACLALAACPKGNDPAVAATVTQLEMVQRQIQVYAQENRRAPSRDQGLAVVFDGQVPKDAWGNDLVYVVPGPEGWAFDLVSYGEDGVAGGKKAAADIYWSLLAP
jgi:hypothetical protein